MIKSKFTVVDYTETQLAFIEAIKDKKIPLVDNFLTIGNIFDLDQNTGEFEHIDTHVAFLIFQAGFVANSISRFANIIKAAKEIWYDNGMVNRDEPEEQHMAKLIPWLNAWYKKYPVEVASIELELSNLNEEALETVCCGEESEQENLATELTNNFLNLVFDERYDFFDLDKIADPEAVMSAEANVGENNE